MDFELERVASADMVKVRNEAFSECDSVSVRDGVDGRRLEAVGLCEAVAMASVEDVLVDAEANRSRLCDIGAEDESDAEAEMVRVKNGLAIPSVPKA